MPNDQDDCNSLERRINEAASKTPYCSEAFVFVLETLPLSYSPLLPDPHIDAAELCWRLRDRAIATFGPKARERLESWSIRACDDFGNIVYAMIDSGLIAKVEQDSRADFQGVFDFENAFRTDAKPRNVNIRFQWRLSTLFVLTTVAAIACAGFAKLGFQGAVGTVFSSWIGLIGAYCVALGFLDRSKSWVVAVCVGLGMCALAIAIFLVITLHSATQ